MRNKIILAWFSLFVSSLFSCSAVAVENAAKDEPAQKAIEANATTVNMKTLLLSQPVREEIDRQRLQYLNPVEETPEEVIQPIEEQPKVAQKSGAKVKKISKPKPIYLPYKLDVTAVVKRGDGKTLVLVNDRFNETNSKHITIDYQHTDHNGVVFDVLGKTEKVRVGESLLPRSFQVEKTYELEKRKQPSKLTTKDQATQNTLQQVQIITGH